MNRIVLLAYDPGWAADFAREAQQLREALGALLIELHHIGSTAVPNIVAKPVIDILAGVSSVELLDMQSPCVEALGYEALGELGIPGRRYFRKDSSNGTRTHQIHAFTAGSDEIQRHLHFRDYLRAHAREARAYSELKQDLAACSLDMHSYTEGKTAFIRDIEAKWGRVQ